MMLRKGVSDSLPTVARRTRELKQRIQALASRGAANARTRRVLIAEPGPPGWPERVLRDPLLDPVDKMVWIALRQSAVRQRFPSYARIGQAANVSSKSTVSRAIAILRATRWLARCGTPGTPKSNPGTSLVVYALHDAPLPVTDTLYLDAGYLSFLQYAQAHPHARVRTVVRQILVSLEERVDAGIRRAGNMR